MTKEAIARRVPDIRLVADAIHFKLNASVAANHSTTTTQEVTRQVLLMGSSSRTYGSVVPTTAPAASVT